MSNSIMIVGSGPAIGRGVAEKFGRAGWSVVLAARNPDRLAEEAAVLSAKGITTYTVPADATDPVALRAALGKGNELTGGLTRAASPIPLTYPTTNGRWWCLT